jgi:hypothetical protein
VTPGQLDKLSIEPLAGDLPTAIGIQVTIITTDDVEARRRRKPVKRARLTVRRLRLRTQTLERGSRNTLLAVVVQQAARVRLTGPADSALTVSRQADACS